MEDGKQYSRLESSVPQSAQTQAIFLPRRSLLVLCGPAGSGKSTFARNLIQRNRAKGFKPTMIVSSDECRALVCDDENNQRVSPDAFDLFYFILHKRMLYNAFTIADNTALLLPVRQRLLATAAEHNYATCLLAFNTPTTLCIARDRTRARSVGEQVILYHDELMAQALASIPQEGWKQFYLVDEQQKLNIIVG